MADIVYLLHFSRPLAGRARHYLGSTTMSGLADRLAAHRHGRGARILAAANAAGISYYLVAAFPGGRQMERRLKRRKHLARLCPVCRPDALARQARDMALSRARSHLSPPEVCHGP